MSANERRRFFRIDDRLELRLIKHVDEAAEDTITSLSSARASEIMRDLDERISDSIDAVRVLSPECSELCDLINRKLDFIVDALEISEEIARQLDFRQEEVNISACGLALDTRQRLAPGDEVTLDIRFPPNSVEMHIEAQVVRSIESRPGYFTVFLDFVDLSNDDQEFLIQYVVRRQSVFLQRLREQRDAPEPIEQQKPPW